MILAPILLMLIVTQDKTPDPPVDPTVLRAARAIGVRMLTESEWQAASARGAAASATLVIYDVRDLVEFSPAESTFYLAGSSESRSAGADPAEAIVAQDAARTRALDRLEEHFRRFLDQFDACKEHEKNVQRTQGALIVRATPWTHEYIRAVLDQVRRRKASPRMPYMRIAAFDIDVALAKEWGLEESPVQMVTEPARKEFWRERFFPADASSGEPDTRLHVRPGIQAELGLLVDFGMRGDSVAPYRRFVTGYDRLDGIWPDDRTIFVPRVKTVPFPTARFSGIPLPGEAFEVEMEFDSVAVIGVKDGTGEGGPTSEPTLEEFHFESRLVMEPDNWVFAMLEGGERWKMIAIWMAPRT